MSSIVQFALGAAKCNHSNELIDLIVRVLRDRGITMMSYHHMPPPGAFDHSPYVSVMAIGFPDSWVQRYKDKQYYLIDPIPRRALDECRPFWWSEAAEGLQLSPKEKDYLRAFEEAELGDGLAMPVFGPHGRDGYVGLGCGLDRCDFPKEKVIELHHLCQAAHLRYCEILEQKLPRDVTLSEREQEILRWISKGKSNAVMAEILGLSANTVDTYVRRIFKKFDVTDRVTAALRGFALGLID